MSTQQSSGNHFVVHDVLVGILTGAGVGSILGLFLAARVWDSNILTGLGAVVGAAIFVYLLTRSHRDGSGFMNLTVVASWILLILSTAFIVLLINAIANFQ
jgi:hypothetical protein